MGELFLTSFESVALLLVMAVPGFIVAKLNMVNKGEAVKFLSVTMLYILQPFVTVNSFLNTDFSMDILWNMLAIFLFTTITEIGILYFKILSNISLKMKLFLFRKVNLISSFSFHSFLKLI